MSSSVACPPSKGAIARLIAEALESLGFSVAAAALEEEASVQALSPKARELSRLVGSGLWEEAAALLPELGVERGGSAEWCLLRQRYLEALHHQHQAIGSLAPTTTALTLLHSLVPLCASAGVMDGGGCGGGGGGSGGGGGGGPTQFSGYPMLTTLVGLLPSPQSLHSLAALALLASPASAVLGDAAGGLSQSRALTFRRLCAFLPTMHAVPPDRLLTLLARALGAPPPPLLMLPPCSSVRTSPVSGSLTPPTWKDLLTPPPGAATRCGGHQPSHSDGELLMSRKSIKVLPCSLGQR